MLYFHDAMIKGVAIHTVGNKSLDEFYVLSDNLLSFDSDEHELLMKLFSQPFAKLDQVQQLFHNSDIRFNITYARAFDLFNGNVELMQTSKFLAEHLYDVSTHPRIKSGEFYTVHFTGVVFEGEEYEAIGLFKSDNKEMYANVFVGNVVFCQFTQAINTNNIDKAALILKSHTQEAYTVLIPEIKNAFDSQYWKDDFLSVIARNDNNLKTSQFMRAYRNFVVEKMEENFDLEKADKVALLNDGLKYLKEHETLNCEEFADEVLKDERAIALFHDHLADVSEETELLIPESFGISSKAVKKAQSSYKSVIKLDKNFHLHVHGTRELLEKGYDEEKGMNYYKVYFESEG